MNMSSSRLCKLESDSMPMADTIFMMDVMDSLRNSWGLVYPQEQ